MKTIGMLLLFVAMGCSTPDGEGSPKLMVCLFQQWIWVSLGITSYVIWICYRETKDDHR